MLENEASSGQTTHVLRNDDTIVKEGWLSKRGPTSAYQFQRRWCVLTCSASLGLARIEYFADQGKGHKKGAVHLQGGSRAVAFAHPGAPGDAAKHVGSMPFGFVVDVDPSGGKERRLFYFSADDDMGLTQWREAVAVAAHLLCELRPGDVVSVVQDFRSASETTRELHTGQVGCIDSFDEDGDAFIEIDGVGKEWVHCADFDKLKKEFEVLKKLVVVEIIPISKLVNHWAIRVGTGPASLCYEFEGGGVQIGRHTQLDQGLPMGSKELGTTYKFHAEIKAWAAGFGKKNTYCATGNNTFGGKNCQDFVYELCEFLQVDTGQLPWRQAVMVKTAVGGGAVIAADVALGTGIAAGTAEMAGVGAAALVSAPVLLAGVLGAGAVAVAMQQQGEDAPSITEQLEALGSTLTQGAQGLAEGAQELAENMAVGITQGTQHLASNFKSASSSQ